MFSNLNDGNCPQCLLNDKEINLKLNSSDFWECRLCHLQLCANPVEAIILRFRGKGDININSPNGTDSISGPLLAKADKNEHYISVGYISNETEFKNYLETEVEPIPEIVKNIKHYACLAKDILNNETLYKADKSIIHNFFKDNNIIKEIDDEKAYDILKTRLTIIDSYYSTNMTKRYFWQDSIIDKLKAHSPDSSDFDNSLKEEFVNFAASPHEYSGIFKLLYEYKYGINKKGQEVGKAPSLISKYGYFLTGYDFPIYDSLAMYSYRILSKFLNQFLNHNKVDTVINENSFFDKMYKFNKYSEINDFDALDNLLWLFGKISNSSYYLILGKEKYLMLINKAGVNKIKNGEQDQNVTSQIRKFIKNNIHKTSLKDIFDDELIEFIEFVFNNSEN